MASKELQLMGVRLVNEEDYGKSAFEIAQDHGFEGTEEEWLESLKPVKGVDYNTPEDKQELLDATVSVFQNTKADSIQHKTGSTIVASNSAHLPLNGFKLLGKTTQNGTPTPDAPVALESAGENGSVTVKVMGKNIADLRKVSAKDLKTASATATLSNSFGTTLSATSGDSITVTQSKWPNAEQSNSYQNGDIVFGFYCPLRVGDKIVISFNYEITNNPLNVDGTAFTLQLNTGYQSTTSVKGNKISLTQYINSSSASQADGWNHIDFRNCGTSGVISNFQVEYGKTATEYEPYKEQTLTVPTPNGLPGVPVKSGGNYTDVDGRQWICDEIDFVRGVYVKRTNQITVDGSSDEDWWSGHAKAPYSITIPDIAQCTGDDSQLLCDKYEAATYNSSWNNYDYMISRHGTGANSIAVCFRDIRYLEINLDAWKSYISANPIAIQYVLAEPIVTTLAEEQLEAYAKLHTNENGTTITNDAGAEMELTYYTPSTAVPMVHGPADKGKTFTVDEHGCVTLTKDNPVIACGETILNGVTWYYRKWADGFAECWGHCDVITQDFGEGKGGFSRPIPIDIAYIDEDGNEIYGECNVQLTFRKNQPSAYEILLDPDSTTIIFEDLGPGVNIDCFVYVTRFWKTPEVTDE